jgi:2-polyprenyl-6-methoxyphenol hydroxylase-like FAD-dependent oxidoreductase
VECTPETWAGLGLHSLGGDESLRLLESIFEEQLEGQPLLTKSKCDAGLPWLEFRRVTNQRWHTGNIALVGDAAHTTHFSIGSGMRLALEDACAVTRHVEGGVESGFAAYERERRQAIVRAQRDARLSARWFEETERYAGLEPGALFDVIGMRRSRVLPHVPPRAYRRLLQARRLPARTVRAALRPAAAES